MYMPIDEIYETTGFDNVILYYHSENRKYLNHFSEDSLSHFYSSRTEKHITICINLYKTTCLVEEIYMISYTILSRYTADSSLLPFILSVNINNMVKAMEQISSGSL